MMRRVVIVPTDSHIQPHLMADAVVEAAVRTSGAVTVAAVMIPAVVPPTLPIGAYPPRLAARLRGLRDAAREAMASRGMRGRAEIVPCRSVSALLLAAGSIDTLILVGRAGWNLRRAAHGIAGDVVFIPAGEPRGHSGRIPASQRRALAE
jgi:hypothetical protein